MANAYLDRKITRIGAAGRRNEKKFAKKIGARLTPNSGATESAKADMILGDLLIEHKSTARDTFAIKREWLLKVCHEALHTNKKPALAFTFTNVGGASHVDGEWIAMRASDFKDLVGD